MAVVARQLLARALALLARFVAGAVVAVVAGHRQVVDRLVLDLLTLVAEILGARVLVVVILAGLRGAFAGLAHLAARDRATAALAVLAVAQLAFAAAVAAFELAFVGGQVLVFAGRGFRPRFRHAFALVAAQGLLAFAERQGAVDALRALGVFLELAHTFDLVGEVRAFADRHATRRDTLEIGAVALDQAAFTLLASVVGRAGVIAGGAGVDRDVGDGVGELGLVFCRDLAGAAAGGQQGKDRSDRGLAHGASSGAIHVVLHRDGSQAKWLALILRPKLLFSKQVVTSVLLGGGCAY